MASRDSFNEYLKRVGNITGNQKQFQDDLNRGETNLKNKYGYDKRLQAIESANNQTYQTEKLLSNLQTNVQRRTAGRGLNNAQLQRVTAAERDPLSRQLDEGNRGVQVARGNLTDINDMLQTYRANRMGENENLQRAQLNEADSYFKKYQSEYQGENDAEERAFRNRQLALQQQQARDALNSQAGIQKMMLDYQKRKDYEERSQTEIAANYARAKEKEKAGMANYLEQQYSQKKVDDSFWNQLKTGGAGFGKTLTGGNIGRELTSARNAIPGLAASALNPALGLAYFKNKLTWGGKKLFKK